MSEDSAPEEKVLSEEDVHASVFDATETLTHVIEADIDHATADLEDFSADAVAFSVCLRAAVRHLSKMRIEHDIDASDIRGVARVAITAGLADVLRKVPVNNETAAIKNTLDSGAEVMADLLEDCIAAYLGGPQYDQ